MLRWQKQKSFDKIVKRSLILSKLFIRIQAQRILDAQSIRISHIRSLCPYLLIFFVGLLLFQCPNRVYNAWAGPFHFTLDKFSTHFKIYNGLLYDRRPFLFRWSPFQYEYLQIELGENKIDTSKLNSLRVFYGHHSYERLLYIFNRVIEPTIDTSYSALYVKLASHEDSHFHRRHPYGFRSFNIRTLQCIVRQLDIMPTEYMRWPEKSMYIRKIEEIYNQNSTEFNIKVILKCGILLGYLYRPNNEYVYPGYSYVYHKFSNHIRVFDASASYSPYISYTLIVFFFIIPLIKVFSYIVLFLFNMIHRSSLTIHQAVQNQMKISNITSLEMLDDLILNASIANQHHDRLFLVENKYLVILMIDIDEDNTEVLRQFYVNVPIKIISIATIRSVEQDHIIIENDNVRQWIYMPTDSYNSSYNPCHWLHNRLLVISSEYRYRWEEQQQREAYRQRLEALTEEETQYQLQEYGNNIYRMWQRVTSASPHFIAQFRLATPQIVNNNHFETKCSICLEELQIGQQFAQWPCQARHIFHFECMLTTLRTQNTCPLCRYPVEAANLPGLETVFRRTWATIMPHLFN